MLNKIKTELTELFFLSRDALHIHLGIAIYLVAMLIFRRGPASMVPWLVLLAFELVNEVLDVFHGNHIELDISGALRDIGNTMLWPTVALIVARVIARRQRSAATAQA
ncbi:hypothetical protein VW35_15145 [Devosia soli]|uniref:VanZ-like domain-containing protein n=1 Tax=Devosia soli TaxID=361041 RepID=A0A0F5L759_9HYPH|nr:hypothetical protein [Devosia soli]KKB77477.1 hypothetical protein VW35_15145 [Devosia soli]